MYEIDLEKLTNKINSLEDNSDFDIKVNEIFSICYNNYEKNNKNKIYNNDIIGKVSTKDILKAYSLMKEDKETIYIENNIRSHKLIDFVFNAKYEYDLEEEEIY